MPPPFPVRRDVAVRAAVSDARDQLSFSDAFWPEQGVLAVAAVRIAGSGVEAARAAVALRQVLRAAVEVERDPQAALALCLDAVSYEGVAAALLRLDTGSGALSTGTVGQARVTVPQDGKRSVLSAGDVVWLTAGDVEPPGKAAGADLDALVAPAAANAADGCVAAVLFKAPARTTKAATFSLPNDHAAIPGLLAQVQRFLERGAVAEDDAAGVEVALDEILSNAISYAFGDGMAHEILVAPSLAGDRLTIEIRDDGAPFNPLLVPPPNLSDDIDERQIGGLGMHFVRTVMDDVEYRRCDGWNVLTLGKRLTRAPQLQETRS